MLALMLAELCMYVNLIEIPINTKEYRNAGKHKQILLKSKTAKQGGFCVFNYCGTVAQRTPHGLCSVCDSVKLFYL